jgi:probable phosphoglycerate mutase
MTPHTIYFVRHGETQWNMAGRLQGRSDSPLTPRGREQAARNGEVLLETVPDLHDLHFVASPLGRTRTTMEIVRERIGLPAHGYETDERLAEMGFGDWEGLTWPHIRIHRSDEWTTREQMKWTHAAKGGESFHDVAQRLRDWVATIERDIVVVSHGAVGRVLRGLYHRMSELEIPDLPNIQQDCIYRFAKGSEATL